MGRVDGADGAIDSILFNGYSQKFRIKEPTQPLWRRHVGIDFVAHRVKTLRFQSGHAGCLVAGAKILYPFKRSQHCTRFRNPIPRESGY